MDTILAYVDNMFAKLPRTSEVAKAKKELCSMMEDKYNEMKAEGKSENEAIGIVISEFGNMDEILNELGINDTSEDKANYRFVTREEADDFITSQISFSKKIAIGVRLCIMSPILLILLTSFAQNDKISLSENASETIGVLILLSMIASAVAIFIFSAFKFDKYSNFVKEPLDMDYTTKDHFKKLADSYKGTFATSIVTGVVLCILSVTPVIVAGALVSDTESNEWFHSIFTCMFLFIISCAVPIFIKAGMKYGGYQQLLQEGDFTIEKKTKSKLVDKIAGVYWPLMTAVYLGWSFISGDWGITWIVWPVSGVLFGAIAAFCNAIDKNN